MFMAKQSGRTRPAARVNLGGLSWGVLEREMKRRRTKAVALAKKRDRLHAAIAKLDAQIRTLNGNIRSGRVPGRARRSRGGDGLAQWLHRALQGKTMGVTEVANAVKEAGYGTKAENFRTIVNACLLKHKDLFKKVERGQYTAV
jgi:hypothetical protein